MYIYIYIYILYIIHIGGALRRGRPAAAEEDRQEQRRGPAGGSGQGLGY